MSKDDVKTYLIDRVLTLKNCRVSILKFNDILTRREVNPSTDISTVDRVLRASNRFGLIPQLTATK